MAGCVTVDFVAKLGHVLCMLACTHACMHVHAAGKGNSTWYVKHSCIVYIPWVDHSLYLTAVSPGIAQWWAPGTSSSCFAGLWHYGPQKTFVCTSVEYVGSLISVLIK